MSKKEQVFNLRDQGFEGSYLSGKHVRVSCFQCQATVINGIPCHETGCPMAKHECNGCNEVIPTNQRYCQDCV